MKFSKVKLFAGLLAISSMTGLHATQAQEATTEAPADNATANGEAEPNEDPIALATSFAEELTQHASDALTNENASEEEQLAAFQAVLTEGLALETIGKFMLGDARKTMTDAQLARYDEIFPPYITKQYAEQFDDIVGQTLEVIDAKALGRRDVIVRTQIERTNGTPVNVDWRIRKLRSGERKAIDIIVSGVSIMLVKREEFSSFIAQNGIDALLDTLEAETAGN